MNMVGRRMRSARRDYRPATPWSVRVSAQTRHKTILRADDVNK